MNGYTKYFLLNYCKKTIKDTLLLSPVLKGNNELIYYLLTIHLVAIFCDIMSQVFVDLAICGTRWKVDSSKY